MVPESGSRDAIADLLAGARVMREALLQPEPGPDSAAEHELATARGSSRAVERLIACADLWTLVGGDQLYGVSLLVRDGGTVFSLFPLLRSVIEHSTSVFWILDDTVSPRRRAARASLAALRSAEELNKAASRMGGKGSETHQATKARFKQLREDVQAEFGSLQLEPLQLENESLASPTDVIEHFGERWGDPREWIGMYDYLCATATHPSLSPYEYFNPTRADSVGAEVSADLLNRLIRAALVPYLKALEALAAYMGWPTEPLDVYIDRANDVLGTVLNQTESC